MKYIVFDIDGVLADCSHRLKYIKGEKKDYDKFYFYDKTFSLPLTTTTKSMRCMLSTG